MHIRSLVFGLNVYVKYYSRRYHLDNLPAEL